MCQKHVAHDSAEGHTQRAEWQCRHLSYVRPSQLTTRSMMSGMLKPSGAGPARGGGRAMDSSKVTLQCSRPQLADETPAHVGEHLSTIACLVIQLPIYASHQHWVWPAQAPRLLAACT